MLTPRLAFAEPPPETSTIRLYQMSGVCIAPQYVAEEMLRSEGFTDVQYIASALDVGAPSGFYKLIATGGLDVSIGFIAPFVAQLDAGLPVTLLAGVHVGCFELFATGGVQTVRDLKGRTVAVPERNSSHELFVSSIAAHVGLDPRRDIRWVSHPAPESIQLLAAGKIDAMIGFPPVPGRLGTSSSTAPWIAPGPSTSAAWSVPARSSCASIQWRPSVPCARC